MSMVDLEYWQSSISDLHYHILNSFNTMSTYIKNNMESVPNKISISCMLKLDSRNELDDDDDDDERKGLNLVNYSLIYILSLTPSCLLLGRISRIIKK